MLVGWFGCGESLSSSEVPLVASRLVLVTSLIAMPVVAGVAHDRLCSAVDMALARLFRG